MKNQFLKYVAKIIMVDFLSALDLDQLKLNLDKMIEMVEATPNKLDDKLLPTLRFAREVLCEGPNKTAAK